jgi:Kelch motif
MRKAAVPLTLILVLLAATFMSVAQPASGAEAPAENTWTSKAPMHVARSDLGVVAVNGKIYAIGGTTITYVFHPDSETDWEVVGTNEEYDPATDTWTYREPMPTPLASFSTVVYENKIYCFGTDVIEVYDPATDKWENRTASTVPKAGQINVGGKIYLINQSSTQLYDPQSGSWITKTPMPVVQYGVTAVVGTKVYIIGGTSSFLESITQIYDTQTDTWSEGFPPSPLNGRYSWAVATSGVMAPRNVYALGLVTGYLVTGGVDVYHPKTDQWSHAANMPTPRDFFGAAVVNDSIYVIGGRVETGSDYLSDSYIEYAANEQYTPFGYGSPDASYVLETTPPKVKTLSPAAAQTYNQTNVTSTFTVDKKANWRGYSLDGEENITVTGNFTLTDLPNGLHNLTVYANDTYGNMGVSETISFTVAVPEPFPVAPVAAGVAMVAVVIVAAGLLLYNRKRHKEAAQT